MKHRNHPWALPKGFNRYEVTRDIASLAFDVVHRAKSGFRAVL